MSEADVLQEIVANKRLELADVRARAERENWAQQARDLAAKEPAGHLSFLESLKRTADQFGLAVIAEVKKASPSAGLIRPDFDPVAIAESYARNHAAGISVLTDAKYFQGSIDDLRRVSAAVKVPTLRKEFILDPAQIYEAKLAGASAVLLIAECLSATELADLVDVALKLNLTPLVELYESQNLLAVLASGTPLIGINNRNLRTMVTDLQHTLDLVPNIPADRLVVSESGIKTREDVQRLRAAGVRTVLVGETLMRHADPGAKLGELMEQPADRTWVTGAAGDDEQLLQQLRRVLGDEFLRKMHVYPLPANFKLSVAMPVFNEKNTIHEIIRRVRAVRIPKEIVIVDDFSTDGTRDILRELEKDPDIRVFYHEYNQGKGAAVRTAFKHVEGDVVLIQDADLEYDPAEYFRLIQPIVDGRADVVYGSRFLGETVRVHLFWHRVANGILTLLSNMMTNLNLTDMETCYKVFRRDVLKDIHIKQNRFGIEPELTAKLARRRVRIYELPISYAGRDYSEGKHIGIKDAFKALYCIIRYGLAD